MTQAAIAPRQDWTREEIAALFDLPLPDLMLRALKVREANWPEGRIQKSQLLSTFYQKFLGVQGFLIRK
mgnify:CR=1 FL=1